ncbi:MAG: ABATE domain-containing protein [Chloroflexota bacterium]
MIEAELYGGKLNLEEARLCLDFANTANWHASTHPEESLNSYFDLIGWARHVAILTDEVAQHLQSEASRQPAAASDILLQAIDLREAIYRIFSVIAAGRPVEEADLALLNTWLAEATGRVQVIQTPAGFTWRWRGEEQALDSMLWPVAQSAAELLISPELDQVKECDDDRGCGFLFLDTSRNRSRRWCSMQSCGNRAKVQRHRRQQAA